MPDPWYDPSKGDKAAIDDEVNTGIAADNAAEAAASTADKTVFDNGNSGSAKTVTRANGRYQKITLTASAPTLTVAGFTAGQYDEIVLYVIQDATGSRLLPTFSPAARYGAASAPTLSTAAAAKDILKLSSIDGGTNLDVVLVEKGA